MKKIYAFVGISLCLASSLIGKETDEKIEFSKEQILGTIWIQDLRKDFEQGLYQSLLSSLEKEYQEVVQKGRLDEFAQMRQVPTPNEELLSLSRQWEERAKKLIEERNEKLNSLCKEENSFLCDQIHSAIRELKPEQEKALDYLSSLRFKTIDQARNTDEKTLITLDMEYELKSLHLDAHEKNDLQKKQIILAMARINAMQKAADSFQDMELKKKVLLAAKSFDDMQAKKCDWKALQAVSHRKGKNFEKKVGSVLANYEAKKENLYQKEFLAKLDSK